MTFWIIAFVALFAATLVTFLPLLRGKTFWQPAALALIFALPAGGLWIYNGIGTPEAIGLPSPRQAPHPPSGEMAGDADIDTMVGRLRARLDESPDDIEGWILLARTLKTLQRHPEAVDALATAHGIAPDNPDVMVELAEARIFVSSNGQISPESVAMLERALEINPAQQKGLWLMGIAAAQSGDLEGAVAYWQTLLDDLEPGSPVAQSVQKQIDEATARLGGPAASEPVTLAQADPPAAPATVTGGETEWRGVPVRIAASETARTRIPTGATLYVVVRPVGQAVGPPLGVRRLDDPVLPVDVTISDQDSMLAERKISLENEIQLQARISISGSPTAASGDWQSEPVVVPLDSADTVELILDRKVE